LLDAASVAVFDQLGIEYSYDPESEAIREAPLTVAQVEKAFNAPAQSAPQSAAPQSGLRIVNAGKGASNEPLPEWVVQAATAAGVYAIYDNRLTYDASRNQPPFKEAVERGGTGKGRDGQAKGFYPPK
jgi:hypothetical protein